MKISIITVCYNSAATLERTILSVLEQDYPDVEYIIIDGKSTDGTAAILEKYKGKIAKIVSEKDQGIYFALNKGISLVTGDIVGLLHSDDFYPNKRVITEVMKTFRSKNTDSVYGDLQYVARSHEDRVIRNWKSRPYDPELFLKGWMPPHPAFFVKRECYLRFGSFNTSFSLSADYELMLRFLYKHRITSTYIPEVLVKMQVGGASNASLKNRIKANREDREAWKINELKAGNLTLLLKPLSKLRQFF